MLAANRCSTVATYQLLNHALGNDMRLGGCGWRVKVGMSAPMLHGAVQVCYTDWLRLLSGQSTQLLFRRLPLLLLMLPSTYGSKYKQATRCLHARLNGDTTHRCMCRKAGGQCHLLNELPGSCLGTTPTLAAGSDPLGAAERRDPHLSQSASQSVRRSGCQPDSVLGRFVRQSGVPVGQSSRQWRSG
jgi:hypothetical protein